MYIHNILHNNRNHDVSTYIIGTWYTILSYLLHLFLSNPLSTYTHHVCIIYLRWYNNNKHTHTYTRRGGGERDLFEMGRGESLMPWGREVKGSREGVGGSCLLASYS